MNKGVTESRIHVQNLNLSYGNYHVLKNINLEVPDKKITAIIGPSGCGKTTLLKCFNRLIDLIDGVNVSGRILVDGVNIFDPKIDITEIRKKMGLLLQKPYPLPMSIYDNIAYGPKIHGIKDKRKLDDIVQYHLKEAGLWEEVKDRLKEPASKFSIGQQQRLCLARCLAVEPEILLCDEPTAALDPVSAECIENKFNELKQDYSVIIVTHILRQAKRLADYVVFMYMGEVIEYGPAKEIFENPREKKTQEYIKGKFN